jgi:hypothetical protein
VISIIQFVRLTPASPYLFVLSPVPTIISVPLFIALIPASISQLQVDFVWFGQSTITTICKSNQVWQLRHSPSIAFAYLLKYHYSTSCFIHLITSASLGLAGTSSLSL